MSRPIAAAVLLAAGCALLLQGEGGRSASAAGPASGSSTQDSPPASARVLLRSGDPAPGSATFTGFGYSIAALPGGGVAFTDRFRATLFVRRGGETTAIAHAGQASPAGSRFEEFLAVAAGPGGALAFIATLGDGRTGVFRIPAGETEIQVVLQSGDLVDLRDGMAYIRDFDGIGVDAAGGVVALPVFQPSLSFPILSFGDPGALIAIAPDGTRSVILEVGDPIGSALVEGFLHAPIGVNGSGAVVFLARDDRGRQVVGTLAPGSGAAARFLASGGSGPSDTSVLLVRPAINDRGDIAFHWMQGSDLLNVRLQRVTLDGISSTVGRAGIAVPGGGVLREIENSDATIAGDGTVFFPAIRTDGRPGVYAAGTVGGPIAVVEGGGAVGRAGTYWGLRGQRDMSVAPDGTLFFPDESFLTRQMSILAASGGAVRTEMLAGDPVGAARFATFTSPWVQFMGAGPAAAPGGLVIFDARVTGGSRGLYARERGGDIVPVVVEGQPDAAGLPFSGVYFSFHSINAGGSYAFVGAAPGNRGEQAGLYYGQLGEGSPRRLADIGEVIPVGIFGAPGELSYLPLPSPTRINALGQVAVILDDPAGEALLCYDGRDLVRAVVSGDAAPDGGTFTSLFTGSQFLGREIPPALDDSGRITFGAFTSRGDNALFRADCRAGGGGVPVRLVGAGDEVEGRRLSPFEVRNLEVGADGRVLFEAIDSDDYLFGTFLRSDGTITPLARRFDPLLDGDFILEVTPRLAFAGPRGVAYGVSGYFSSESILVRDPAAADDPLVLAAVGGPSPDGGLYLGIGGGQSAGLRLAETGRLGSDGRGGLVFAAGTTEGPEILVIDGLPDNAVPTADAGNDVTAECAGPEGAVITLDGAGSSDPDGDPLTWTWTGPFGTVGGEKPTVTIPVGTWTIGLVVSDGQGVSEAVTVTVVVQDTAPPLMQVTPDPAVLWPPDRRMVPVGLEVVVTDICDPAPSITLAEVTSTEPGLGGTQIADAEVGTDDRAIRLQAARDGGGPGRMYLVTYRVEDRAGNSVTSTMTVTVPHDLRSHP